MIKNKTDEIVEKENQKLTKYIGKTSSLLKMELGAPSEDFKNEKGNLILVYNTKKYGIPCERRFEIDSNSIVIGFVSKIKLGRFTPLLLDRLPPTKTFVFNISFFFHLMGPYIILK